MVLGGALKAGLFGALDKEKDLVTLAFLYGLGFGLVHPVIMALLVDRVSEKERAGQPWVLLPQHLTWV